MDALITIFFIIVLFFSVIIHEIAHGSMALYLGDPTAKYAGRLTLNPLSHIDPIGSILLPLFMFLTTSGSAVFGWAKPVPINPYNFRDQKWGEVKVSLAGPGSNILIAIVFGLLVRFLQTPEPMFSFFSIISVYNFALGIFNLVPIPPLDGYHILFKFLPAGTANFKNFFMRYSLIVLLAFILLGGISAVFAGAEGLYTLVSGVGAIVP